MELGAGPFMVLVRATVAFPAGGFAVAVFALVFVGIFGGAILDVAFLVVSGAETVFAARPGAFAPGFVVTLPETACV